VSEPLQSNAVALIALLCVLAVLSVCLASFVFVLARKDLTPRVALEKLQNRIKNHTKRQLPNFRDAPYRRLADRMAKHHPTLLNLQTSEGSGQACHPDVVYIREGFGAGRWPYWMVCTPYAYGDFVRENPEIFASYDGVRWTVPDGAENPVVPKPAGSMDHNSDPDMLFVDGKLWLYYRETRRTTGQVENRIYLTTNMDGVSWSPAAEVLVACGDTALLMSPAVVYDSYRFHMWTVEREAERFKLVRRTSEDGVRWSAPFECAVAGLSDREPWHLDVIREEGRLSALLVSFREPTDWRLHYAHSLDDGKTWNVQGYLFEPAYEFEEALQYRASLLKIDGALLATYQVWYSAANRRQMFSIAYQVMVREGGTLEPISGFPELEIATEVSQ
jgi:hypothetical protein